MWEEPLPSPLQPDERVSVDVFGGLALRVDLGHVVAAARAVPAVLLVPLDPVPLQLHTSRIQCL